MVPPTTTTTLQRRNPALPAPDLGRVSRAAGCPPAGVACPTACLAEVFHWEERQGWEPTLPEQGGSTQV